jgi:signal peptidase I
MSDFFKKLYIFSTTWTGSVIIVLLIIFFVIQSFVIPSGSMIGTLLVGDYLFVKKFTYGTPSPHIPWLEINLTPWEGLKLIDGDKPKRGDIIVFRKPHQTNLHFVKRCVGVSGDKIMLKNKDLYLRPFEGDDFIRANYPAEKIVEIGGLIWVKNPYEDKFSGIHHDDEVKEHRLYHEKIFNMSPIIVEKNHYFAMGDNRDHSNDSRFWGSVPYENIEGTPWMIFFSIDKNHSVRWNRMFTFPK